MKEHRHTKFLWVIVRKYLASRTVQIKTDVKTKSSRCLTSGLQIVRFSVNIIILSCNNFIFICIVYNPEQYRSYVKIYLKCEHNYCTVLLIITIKIKLHDNDVRMNVLYTYKNTLYKMQLLSTREYNNWKKKFIWKHHTNRSSFEQIQNICLNFITDIICWPIVNCIHCICI